MKSRLVQKVFLRRDGKMLMTLPTRSLISQIENGTLLPTDEFSGDGKQWVRLDRHHQLSRWFKPDAPPPSLTPFERDLQDLAGMLREINQG